uniref:Uncharacterized protein n=1 Tax=Tanacetum cinerariifolium TaxID=118510 RepID=A0A699GXI6_TANCI|nr:hypothetical protein [Tanacetum cinerariifolium]
MQQIQDKARKSCMVSFQQLHSHLKLLSNKDLKGTRTESGFKRAFTTLFGQDLETFTESKEQDTSNRSGNDAHADDADIRPIYDEEPMTEVQTTAEINVFATGQQHTEQPKFNYERKVDQNAEQCHDTFVRQSTAFKSERPRISKPRFASQVDVNDNLPKPVTTHYLPNEREVSSVKPHHVIASSNSRNSSKNMPRFSSNDMVHNHYLEEAKNKTQDEGRNSKPSVMPSARSQSTANGSKPKPRTNNQNSRNWPASKSSCVTIKTVPIAEHSRNFRNFSDSKHFVCSTFGLRWVPTGKIFASSTTKVDSEPTMVQMKISLTNMNTKKVLISVQEFWSDEQAMTFDHNCSKFRIHDHSNKLSSSKLVPKVVPPAVKTATS